MYEQSMTELLIYPLHEQNIVIIFTFTIKRTTSAVQCLECLKVNTQYTHIIINTAEECFLSHSIIKFLTF